MGMGLLRWLLWPRRARDIEEDEPPRRRRKTKPRTRSHTPGVYRIEVDGEAGRFHRDGPPFSFWSSSRVILILSFLLWWFPPAGPMIAGYVGGRRAGSPIKVVIFAYIGGLIAEQTRRELLSRSGSGASLGVNLVQPILGARPYVDDEEEAYEEDEEVHRSRRPVRTRAHGHPAAVGAPGRTRHRRGHADYLEFLRKIPAELGESGGYSLVRPRHRDEEEADDDDEGEEIVATRTHRVSHGHTEERREHRHPAHHQEADDDEEETESREPPARPARTRSQAEERAIQRFVERALKNYDHSKL